MKMVVVNQSTVFVRHWFKWYRVGRSGEDWRTLEIGKAYEKPKKFDAAKVAKELEKSYPNSSKLPDILDEQAADKRVKKVLKQNKVKG